MTTDFDPSAKLTPAAGRRLARWQSITLVTLLIGYAGYYVCRSNFSVAAKPIGVEFGLDKAILGRVASWGLLFYAVGKVFAGMACDFVGGRKVFLFGMIGSVACTLLFAFGPMLFGAGAAMAVFIVAASLNRLVQSPGWGALVKVSSRWYPVERYGRVMGILCLSYLFGDTIARFFLGGLLALGLHWQGLFLASAGVLALVACASFFLLKPSPAAVGCEEPQANPENLFGSKGEGERPDSLVDLLTPFVTNPAFWLICVISIGLTLIREVLTFWIPTYLAESTGLSEGQAGIWSGMFPLFGGLSSLLAGYATDRYVSQSRSRIMAPLLALLVVPLVVLALLRENGSALAPLVCLSVTALFLMGPYTFLTGVLALDLGGKRGTSTAAGLVDGAGYLGAVIALSYTGWAAEHYGWGIVFAAAAAIAAVTASAAVAYSVLDAARRRRLHGAVVPLQN